MISDSRWMFLSIDPPLFLITAKDGERESGMIATWVLSATLVAERPRIIAALSPDGFTAQLIERSRRFVLHLLAEDQADLVPRFGLTSGRDRAKLAGLEIERSPSGIAILAGVAGWCECEVVDRHAWADRAVFFATAEHGRSSERPPLTLVEAYRTLPPDVVKACEQKRRRDAERDQRRPLA